MTCTVVRDLFSEVVQWDLPPEIITYENSWLLFTNIPVSSSLCRTVEVQSIDSGPGSIPGTQDKRNDVTTDIMDSNTDAWNGITILD